MIHHNIKKAEIKMVGGLKTLVIEWDNGERDEIWGSCLDELSFVFMLDTRARESVSTLK